MKKHSNGRGLIRLLLFCITFLAIVLFANFNLIETDLISGATVMELLSRDDIDIAFVGSSVTLYHFNPEIIKEETGLTSFNSAIHSATLPGSLAITKELYKTSCPRYVVLVLEPYSLNTAKEAVETTYRMMPFMNDPEIMLSYYLNASQEDGEYMERALILRSMVPNSLEGILKTLDTKRDWQEALIRYSHRIDPAENYMGSGFIRHDPNPQKLKDDIRTIMYREGSDGDYYPLLDETVRMLKEYRTLVESHGSQLIIAACPNHTSHCLAEPSFLPYTQSLMRYCQEEGIPCFNFQFAKPEFMECLDEYFFDIYHMCGAGADILTDAFCRVFTLWQSGNDISELFYANDWLYQDSLHIITNTWVWPRGNHLFHADANVDFHSEAEYQFVLHSKDGTDTLLRDYSSDPDIECDLPDGFSLRVYARIAGNPESDVVYYDYPDDFWYAARNEDFEEL